MNSNQNFVDTINRIDDQLGKIKSIGGKALITFLTAGDPDLDTTKKIILDMDKNGADLIEIGVPFSDPMAEGPVIQAANERALSNDIDLSKIMEMVREVRKESNKPLVYLMYYNSIYTYGLDRFFKECSEVGIDGVIIPDLPFEESSEIEEYTEKYNVHQIMLVAPTSEKRLQKICAKSKGFLYCVSSLGVTGMRNSFSTNMSEFFDQIYKYCNIPACIGFGISSPEQAKELKQYCDGVIVGSAIVNRIGEGKTVEEKISSVSNFVKSLKQAL